MKRFVKVCAVSLAAAIAIVPLASCDLYEENQPDGVEIAQEEIELIETLQAEGCDDLEIAEALVSNEEPAESSGSAEEIQSSYETEAQTSEADSDLTADIHEADDSSSSESRQIPGGISIPVSTPEATSGEQSTSTAETEEEIYEDEYIPVEPATSSDYVFRSDIEDECIELINGLRKAEAVRSQCVYYVPIVRASSEEAWNKAHTRCKEIITDWSHNSASGSGLGSECLYNAGGEVDASAIVYCWQNSPGHYALLMGGCTSRAGLSSIDAVVGVLYYNGKTYACYGQIQSNYGYSPDSGYEDPDQCHHNWVTIEQRVDNYYNLIDVRECEYCHETIDVYVGSATPTPAPSDTVPTEPQYPQEPPDNGCEHDWEYTGDNDEYDYFRCTKCGETYAERYTDYPTGAAETTAPETPETSETTETVEPTETQPDEVPAETSAEVPGEDQTDI